MVHIILYIICGIICLIELVEYTILAILIGRFKRRFYSKTFRWGLTILQVILAFIYVAFIALIICLFMGIIK